MSLWKPLDASRIRAGLGTLVVGADVAGYDVCDSTNQRAWDAARAGAQMARPSLPTPRLPAGDARRSWLDRPGDCLLLSVLLRPAMLAPGEAHLLTMLAASATAAAVQAGAGLAVELKWPNDIVVGERKLAGILVETSLLGDSLEAAVVGIGLNVNLDVESRPEISTTATSLARELGQPVDRLAIAREVLRQLDLRYFALGSDRAGIFAEWRGRLATLGRRVEIVGAEGDRRVVEAEDVMPDGALVGRLGDGARLIYHFGEVSLRAPE